MIYQNIKGENMSVLMKGVTMPKDCDTCQFSMINDCNLWMIMDVDEIHPECPLTELPEKHGRLIDADEVLKEHCTESCRKKPSCEEDCIIYDMLHFAKTVIESEGEV